MDSFLLVMRRLQFFVFSVLAGLLLGTTYLVIRWHTSRPTAVLGIILVVMWMAFVTYLYVIYFSGLSQKAKYLIKVAPVIIICLGFSLLIILGFVRFLMTAGDALRFSAPESDGPVSLSTLLWFVVLILLVCVLIMPIITFVAVRNVMRMLRVQHHIDGSVVRFFNDKQEWVIDLQKIRSIVLGETNIVACKDEEEEDLALDILNRPYALSFSERPLDGVLYLDNDLFVRDARSAGLEVRQERLATIIKVATPRYRRAS